MRYHLFLVFLFLAVQASAQQGLLDSVEGQRKKLEKTGFLVLGSWSVLNVATGLAGAANTGGEQRQFHRANAIWGGVNLAISGLGYLLSRRERREAGLAATFKKQQGVEKLFLFNTALDLGYVAFGLYTRERAGRFTGEKRARLQGTGNSMLLQGGFLALFDGVLYLLHARNGRRLQQTLGVTGSENGLGLSLRF